MTQPTAIAVRDLGKNYPRGSNAFSIFWKTMVGGHGRDGFWALRDVSFDIAAGSSVGIVGRNGSGKSTLLQLICGTLQPSTGSVAVSGRVAAMLELGAGFSGDFTGRENVFLAAGVYGLSERQIRERFSAIESFADIGPYIDRPVSEYSSGMYARLAFAVCAHVDADILVVDEILGVGDAAFQRKCQRFMQEFRRRGTLVFVSHDPSAVLGACEQAIWLDQGHVVASGDVEAVLSRYMDETTAADYDTSLAKADVGRFTNSDVHSDLRLQDRNVISVSRFSPDCASHGFGGARITDCYFSRGDGQPLDTIRGGQTVTLHIRAGVTRELQSPIFGYMFRNAAGQNLFGDNTYLTYRKHPPTAPAGSVLEAQMEFQMPYLPRGDFTLAPSIIAGTQQNHVHVNWLEDALILSVRNEAVRHGKVGATIHGIQVSYVERSSTAASPTGAVGHRPAGSGANASTTAVLRTPDR